MKREKQQATQEFGLIQAFPAHQPMNFTTALVAVKKQTRNDFIGNFREFKEKKIDGHEKKEDSVCFIEYSFVGSFRSAHLMGY